jgi:Prephenate dehydratase
MKNEKIFYQGSKGSYSESVLLKIIPDYELVSCKTFQEVSKNTTQKGFGALPVENFLWERNKSLRKFN